MNLLIMLLVMAAGASQTEIKGHFVYLLSLKALDDRVKEHTFSCVYMLTLWIILIKQKKKEVSVLQTCLTKHKELRFHREEPELCSITEH